MSSPRIPSELESRLWDHQKDAINFALPYLRNPRRQRRTALVRMPTGTGKTGVIAVLSLAIPPPAWTLILTPWFNLCDQMVKDLNWKFWKARDWTPPKSTRIERLYPRKLEEILGRPDQRLVLVATFSTLVTLFNKEEYRTKYHLLAAKLSQVFVDEGHYEPAVEWGQAVKELQAPTLLLTATPYRNDLKLFRVKKEDVCHYTHEDAEAQGIIRKVKFKSIGMNEPTDKHLKTWCELFANFWKGSQKKKLHKNPRAIICCARMATVRLVTSFLHDFGVQALGIHERFAKEKKKVRWLTDKAPTAEVPFDVWVHQNKLTEGLDDHRFCVVGVLNRIRNDRKLIQQIGRVLRRTPDRAGQGEALVIHSDDLPVRRSWEHYKKFETQPEMVDPDRYYRVLDLVLKAQPEMEYFNRRFRERFDRDSAELSSHVLLRASTVVRRIKSSFDPERFSDFVSDFLLLEDRLLLGREKEPISGSGESRLWIYAVFGNSSLLVRHSQYEIRLGAMAVVNHGDLVFLIDTEGAYPSEYLNKHTRRLGDDELGRILGNNITPQEVSLLNPFPVGATVHHSTIRSYDLNATPAQLTDAALVLSRVRATVFPEKAGNTRRQYIGFRQGRVSEQITSIKREAFTVDEFVHWTHELSQLIQAPTAKTPEFFRRYLPRINAPDDITPKFLVVNLFDANMILETPDGEALELEESIVEVSPHPHGRAESPRFACELSFRQDRSGEIISIIAMLSYDYGSQRFRIESENLNSEVLVTNTATEEKKGLTTFLNNNDEAFTVVLAEDTYYTEESFYQVDYTYAEERLTSLLKPVDSLLTATTEKGVDKNAKRWSNNSVFGIVADQRPTALIPTEFGEADLIFCDDLGTEVADFVCVSFKNRRIAFIHGKQGAGRKVSASAMHDVYTQATKNLGVLSRGGARPAHLKRWDRESLWFVKEKKSKTPAEIKIKRWLVGSDGLPVKAALWKKIRSEILDHPNGTKEVWLVLGKTLDKAAFLKQLCLRSGADRDAVTGHLVQLFSRLQAACVQLDVTLRIFCHTEGP